MSDETVWESINLAPTDGRPIWARGWDWGKRESRHYCWAYWDEGSYGWKASGPAGSNLIYLDEWMPGAIPMTASNEGVVKYGDTFTYTQAQMDALQAELDASRAENVMLDRMHDDAVTQCDDLRRKHAALVAGVEGLRDSWLDERKRLSALAFALRTNGAATNEDFARSHKLDAEADGLFERAQEISALLAGRE